MKILIAADMEGIAGVVNWDHVSSEHAEYGRFRKVMTASVNAAVRGVGDGGASEALISDGHAGGRNILLEDLDPRAHLNCGSCSPFAMLKGIDTGVNAALFIGYHARAGTQNAVLCHTWSGRVANLWLNGNLVGEIGLNAMVCGHFGVPVIMVSGDQSACAEATSLLGPVEIAVVKRAFSHDGAECLPLDEAYQRIYEAALRAVTRLKAGEMVPPYRPVCPITVTVELKGVEMADQAELLPGACRLDGKRLEYTAEDAVLAYRAFQVMTLLART
jgi:D-amino peptidase